jgi:hypothetical protein
MKKGVAAALVIIACSSFCLSPPVASASLSPCGTWLPGLEIHQQTADEVRGNLLNGAGEEGLGEGWEVAGDGLGSYGSGLWMCLKSPC